jgi:helix-turn-helix protein
MRRQDAIPVRATTTPQIMTVQDVAAFLKIPPSSVYERTRFRGGQKSASVIPHRRVGKYLRFLSSEVEAWLIALPQSTKTRKRAYHEH